jgi:hypothetical protein
LQTISMQSKIGGRPRAGVGPSLAVDALAARHADPLTTTIYDRRRQTFDRHAAYVVAACLTGA